METLALAYPAVEDVQMLAFVAVFRACELEVGVDHVGDVAKDQGRPLLPVVFDEDFNRA